MSSYSLPVKLHQKSVVIYDACIALRQFPPHCVFLIVKDGMLPLIKATVMRPSKLHIGNLPLQTQNPSYPSRCVLPRVMANANMLIILTLD